MFRCLAWRPFQKGAGTGQAPFGPFRQRCLTPFETVSWSASRSGAVCHVGRFDRVSRFFEKSRVSTRKNSSPIPLHRAYLSRGETKTNSPTCLETDPERPLVSLHDRPCRTTWLTFQSARPSGAQPEYRRRNIMSVRKFFAGLALVAALLTNIGCCHKHRHCCSPCGGGGACNSCYASPASRTDVPNLVPVPGNPQ
jgi:hypothetical protein